MDENTPSLQTPIVRLPAKTVVPDPESELSDTVPRGLSKKRLPLLITLPNVKPDCANLAEAPELMDSAFVPASRLETCSEPPAATNMEPVKLPSEPPRESTPLVDSEPLPERVPEKFPA